MVCVCPTEREILLWLNVAPAFDDVFELFVFDVPVIVTDKTEH